jgi:hypothetical protein
MMNRYAAQISACFVSLLCFNAPVQANKLEDLLSNPAIQALLNRQGDLDSSVLKCKDPAFRRRSGPACQQADDAQRLAGLPAELRMLLSRPQSANSIRELCLGVQGLPMQESYLCAELYRADPPFKQQAEQARAAKAEQLRDRP